ncbi:hypothetical protein COP2_039353 [Malus domestica]
MLQSVRALPFSALGAAKSSAPFFRFCSSCKGSLLPQLRWQLPQIKSALPSPLSSPLTPLISSCFHAAPKGQPLRPFFPPPSEVCSILFLSTP